MANTSTIAGLVPVAYLDGSPWSGKANMYCIPSTDGSIFAIGDPVTLAGSADSNGVPTIALATAGAGNLVLGAVIGMAGTVYGASGGDPTSLSTLLVPATKTKAYYVLIADSPDIIYEIQEGTDGAALAATSVGLNFDLKSGTNNGYVSGWVLDNDTGATGVTLQLKSLRLAQRRDNAFGTSAKWLVKINHHQFRPGVVGV
jgi:hypothetical protein